MNEPTKTRAKYQAPQLEEQASYTLITGISLPIGASSLGDFDTLGEEE
jgi:hypothetical protein